MNVEIINALEIIVLTLNKIQKREMRERILRAALILIDKEDILTT